MSNGPIEFMGEHSEPVTPASEHGGAGGLIQPEPHAMTASEASNALMRAASTPTTMVTSWSTRSRAGSSRPR